jgi:membrane-bound serine protease (ClpP class)
MIAFAAIFLFLGRLAMQAQRQPPMTGSTAMLSAIGRALTDIVPERAGQVEVRGEIWSAVSSAGIPAGTPVRIVGMQGLTLTVAPSTSPGQEGRSL